MKNLKKIMALIILLAVAVSVFSQSYPAPNSVSLKELYEIEFMVKEQIRVLEDSGESAELVSQLKRYLQSVTNEIRTRMAVLNKEM